MIRLIEGTVASSTVNHVVIETASGLGYYVAIPTRLLCLPGERIRLHTHLAVRETALDLYGFTNAEDLVMFELLLTLSGIGPKSALQILDQAPRELIEEAVGLEDPTHLTKLAGVSKKTAEKIILGLKDKIDTTRLTHVSTPRNDSTYQDAFDTLVTLGYNPQSVRDVLETQPGDKTTSELVALALKQLS